jgi:hypothetical protein
LSVFRCSFFSCAPSSRHHGRRLDALKNGEVLARTTRRITLTHEGSVLEDCQRKCWPIRPTPKRVYRLVKASGYVRITAPAGLAAATWKPPVTRLRKSTPT